MGPVMSEPDMIAWLSVLPPLVAIGLALGTRNVLVALLAALLTGEVLLNLGAPWLGVTGVAERTADTLADGYNARVIVFCLAVGALAALMQRTGGIGGFLLLLDRFKLARTRAGAGLVTTVTGMAVFVDTNLSIFTAAFVGKPLFEKLKLSRVRLAYILDSTCAPVSVLVLVNGWGAYALGLIGDNAPRADALGILALTVPLNFYALLAVGAALFTAVSGRTFGPLARADARNDTPAHVPGDISGQIPGEPPLTDPDHGRSATSGHAALMLVPIGVMILASFGFLYLTGNGNMLAGSGARAVLWSVCLAIFVVFVMAWAMGIARPGVLGQWAMGGVANLLEPVLIILLSLALGSCLKALGTGALVAGLLGEVVPPALVAAGVFVLAGVMAFTTGTSWGTYALVFPTALPLAIASGAPVPLVAAAVLGGGVFGDHCSPISDTTLVSSLAAGCDHYEHVRTQLPYALVLGAVSAVLYALAGTVWIALAG